MRSRTQKGFWSDADAYMVSLLKEYFGEHATAENDFGFDLLPRISGDHGTYRQVMDMVDGGKIFGYFLLGQNPAVGSAHGKLQRLGMANLDWVVVRDLAMIESATFWKDSPEIETGEIVPETCRTEVFFFPAASHVEKEGTFTQTQRMLQWRDKAVEPTGDQRSDLWFFYHLGRMVKERLAASTDPRDEPVQKLDWSYRVEEASAGRASWAEPSAEDVLKRINGYDVATGRPVNGFLELKADGSTACGCWIYSGVYADGVNQAARRKPHWEQGPYDAEWGWTWPANRRVLYNRCSADPEGKPWSERKKLVWWDAEKGEWTGHDVPDFPKTTPPGHVPEKGSTGPEGLRGDDAFIMQADGKAWLFAPNGAARRAAARRTTSRTSRRCATRSTASRATRPRKVYGRRGQPVEPGPAGAGSTDVFPFVLTAARLTEHHTAGGMSRQLPYLSELQPELFVEVSPELARDARADAPGRVPRRHQPDGRAGPGHGHRPDGAAARRRERRAPGLDALPLGRQRRSSRGDVVNDLFGVVADPNVFIQESKVATCDVRPGPRPRGPQLTAMLGELRDARRDHHRDRHACSPPPPARRTPRTRGVAPRGVLLAGSSREGPQQPVRARWPTRQATPGYAATTPTAVGFFTDTSVCIGCKACEVACKTWNAVPEDGLDLLGMSFDNTGSLGANSWRHVAFIEQPRSTGRQDPGLAGLPTGPSGGGLSAEVRRADAAARPARRWRAGHARPLPDGAGDRRPGSRRSRTWACPRSPGPATGTARRAARRSAG